MAAPDSINMLLRYVQDPPVLLNMWNEGALSAEQCQLIQSCSIEEEKELLAQLEDIAYPVRRLERQLEDLQPALAQLGELKAELAELKERKEETQLSLSSSSSSSTLFSPSRRRPREETQESEQQPATQRVRITKVLEGESLQSEEGEVAEAGPDATTESQQMS